jgi:hypothetical protein
MDVGCFGPFQNILNSCSHTWMKDHPKQIITKYSIAEIASKAYTIALSPLNLQSSFKKSGIFPYNPDAFDKNKIKCFISLNTTANNNDGQSNNNNSLTVEQFIQHHPRSENCELPSKKERKCLSKLTGGQCITTTETSEKIMAHIDSQKPSISKKTVQKDINNNFNQEHLNEDTELVESDLCCVCKQFSPKDVDKSNVYIVKWAQCDRCQHWTHLRFCSKIKIVRRLTKFLCPCCDWSTYLEE